MITDFVHARDVTHLLPSIENLQDFTWVSQMRYYL